MPASLILIALEGLKIFEVPKLQYAKISPVSTRPKVFRDFFPGKQLSQTADERGRVCGRQASAFICVHLRFPVCRYLKIYGQVLITKADITIAGKTPFLPADAGLTGVGNGHAACTTAFPKVSFSPCPSDSATTLWGAFRA